jgi:hypothetical protein
MLGGKKTGEEFKNLLKSLLTQLITHILNFLRILAPSSIYSLLVTTNSSNVCLFEQKCFNPFQAA